MEVGKALLGIDRVEGVGESRHDPENGPDRPALTAKQVPRKPRLGQGQKAAQENQGHNAPLAATGGTAKGVPGYQCGKDGIGEKEGERNTRWDQAHGDIQQGQVKEHEAPPPAIATAAGFER